MPVYSGSMESAALSDHTYSTEETSWHILNVVEGDQQFVEKHSIIPTSTPINETLTAKYLYSFAYRTFRTRSPHMISELIRCMKEKEDWIISRCGRYAHFDLRRVIWSLTILRDEILENRPFKMFHDKEPDVREWNVEIKRLVNREKNSWFTSDWLFAECYLFRRIWAAFRRAETLVKFDYFSPEKIMATRNVDAQMDSILKATYHLPRSRKNLQLMLKLSLWGNRYDLSLTTEIPNEQMWQLISEQDKHLLADESSDVWDLLTEDSDKYPLVVDIVLDNAGFELFTDLLLAKYLIESQLAKKVRFHVKAMPWFVSDATAKDVHWMLNYLRRHTRPQLAQFGQTLKGLIKEKSLELCANNNFWTKPRGFSHMRQLSPCLYVQLSLGALVIFKGDLNYRKLLDDNNYNSTTPFGSCLGGFMPTSICALRVINSDIYCGLPVCVVEWLTEEDPYWMYQAEKAVIQLAVKPSP